MSLKRSSGWGWVEGLVSLHPAYFCLLLVALSACTAVPPPEQLPAKPVGPRLIRVGNQLYVKNAPENVFINHLLYAREAAPIPGTTDHRKIGILRGLDRTGGSLKVAWFTLIDENVDAALAGEGLPVDRIGQDLRARIGRYWGHHVARPIKTFPGPEENIILELDLGQGDDVRPGDKYDVLGEPNTDPLNFSIDSFKTLGTCTVLPFGADMARSRCQIDRGIEAPVFGPDHWAHGGYVKAITHHQGANPPRSEAK